MCRTSLGGKVGPESRRFPAPHVHSPFTCVPPCETENNRCGGEHQDWEEWVKDKSREESLANAGLEGEADTTATSVAAKTLCIPFDQPDLPEGTKCIASGMPATCWVMWGRSY